MKRMVETLAALVLLFLWFLPAAFAITPEQCNFFASDGKVSICHATQWTKEPFVHISVATEACINSHTHHPEDFVDFLNQGCETPACLPASSPCDPTLSCCEGTVCENGTCVPQCVPAGAPCVPEIGCCSGLFCELEFGSFVCRPPQ